MVYKKFVIALEIVGMSRRWHVYSPAGVKLTKMGFTFKTDAKRFVNSLLQDGAL